MRSRALGRQQVRAPGQPRPPSHSTPRGPSMSLSNLPNRVPRPPRRSFLKATAAAATTPYFFSATSAFAQETAAKNDRKAIGLIGAGGMGRGNMRSASKWIDVVAIADVDAERRAQANQSLSQGKADVYNDYRKVLERDDLDAVHIATPDHWHTKPLIEAMLAGKDIYCEKPLTLTIDKVSGFSQ